MFGQADEKFCRHERVHVCNNRHLDEGFLSELHQRCHLLVKSAVVVTGVRTGKINLERPRHSRRHEHPDDAQYLLKLSPATLGRLLHEHDRDHVRLSNLVENSFSQVILRAEVVQADSVYHFPAVFEASPDALREILDRRHAVIHELHVADWHALCVRLTVALQERHGLSGKRGAFPGHAEPAPWAMESISLPGEASCAHGAEDTSVIYSTQFQHVSSPG